MKLMHLVNVPSRQLMAGCSRGLDLSKHSLHTDRLLFTNLVVCVTFYTKGYRRLERRAPTLEDVFGFFCFGMI